MKVPIPIAAASALIAIAAVGGAAYAGYDYGATSVREEWSDEKNGMLEKHAKKIKSLMTKQARAQLEADAVASRLKTALRSARNAPQKKISCPPTGDLRDAVVPGLADRLRDIDAAADSRHGASPSVEVLPP